MRNPLARLWTDKATITRPSKVKDDNNISDFIDVVVGSDIPCRVSWNVKVPRTDATLIQTTDMEARLFFGLDTDIKAGDIVTLVRDGYTYVFQEITIPMRHSRHLEVNCKAQQKRA